MGGLTNFSYLKDDNKEMKLSELRNKVFAEDELKECCPAPEESDQLCVECLKYVDMGHIPNKAKLGFDMCADCYKILTDP